MVAVNNVIHISKSDGHPLKRRRELTWERQHRWNIDLCVSDKGLDSIASPPEVSDHAKCTTGGEGQYGSWMAACKQMSLEMSGMSRDMLSKNALQFADLDTADLFLFGLSEENRASITHLRLAVPHSIIHNRKELVHDGYDGPWNSICNYFSNPWGHKSVISL